MKEEFLHYCWKFKRFNFFNLQLTDGEAIEIIDFGFHNQDAGPDFFNAKIKIKDTIWVGNIEIHVKSSNWNKHNHQTDKAYDNVILHVVYEHDLPVKNSRGAEIPTLELIHRIDTSLYARYQNFIKPTLPCASFLRDIPMVIQTNFTETLFIQRLQNKSSIIREDLRKVNFNWEHVFYMHLLGAFGMKVNKESFQMLAAYTPLSVIQKTNNTQTIEAILFGNAGFLNESHTNKYYLDLQKEYSFQKKKNGFNQIHPQQWKFAKLRPANFPTIRIAQLAILLCKASHLFDHLVKDKKTYEEIKAYLDVSITNGFWFTHYTFYSKEWIGVKRVGEQLIHHIILNVIAPFAFIYAKTKGDSSYLEWIQNIVEEIPAENNRITKQFEGIHYPSAKTSQAVIESYTSNCLNKKCLNCIIGNYCLNKKQDL